MKNHSQFYIGSDFLSIYVILGFTLNRHGNIVEKQGFSMYD